MAITNNLTEFADNSTAQYFTPAQLAESTNITHVGAVLNNRLNYKSYNSLAKMTSKAVVALGDFIVNYSGITTGTIDIDTTVEQWGIFLASIMTDYKLANSVNATTPLSISGTTTNSKTTNGHTHAITTGSVANGNENPVTGGAVYSFINTEISAASPLVITGTTVNGFSAGGHTHAISTGTVGDGSTDIVDGGAVYTYGNPYFTNAVNIKNSNNGFSAGNNSNVSAGGGAIGSGSGANNGGAMGVSARATFGGAIGAGASETSGGGAVGGDASSTSGGAIGSGALETAGGGAVGDNAQATNGFAGGYNAIATANNSVQLGQGTNNDAETIQFYDRKVLNIDIQSLGPTPINGWTHVTSLSGTPLNLTGKYMFFLTAVNDINIGTYYDSIMNLGVGNNLVFNYQSGFVRIYVTTTGAISGEIRPDNGTTATITSINLWYKQMW